MQRKRLRSETRLKIAGWWNSDFSEKPKVAVGADLGPMHIEAMRWWRFSRAPCTSSQAGEADFEVLND